VLLLSSGENMGDDFPTQQGKAEKRSKYIAEMVCWHWYVLVEQLYEAT
jgi:hypothetical protein